MLWNEMFDEWKNGTFRNVYLFSGEEEFVKQSAVTRLRARLLPEGLETMNETVLNAPDAATLIEAAETLPFMADKRLVLVKECPFLTGSAAMEEEVERLCEWLKDPPPESVVVFYVNGSADKRKKLYTFINKHHCAVEFSHLDDKALANWAAGQLKQDSKKLETAALNELVYLAGRGLSGLKTELEKLAAYVQDRPTITVKDVRAVVSPSLESSVFRLVDAVINRDLNTAGQLLGQLMEHGESPLGILALLTRQVRLMAFMKAMKDAGEPVAVIEKKLAMHHFAAQNTERQIRRFSAETLMTAYRACVEADLSVKSGTARDKAALERVIFLLARMEKIA